MLMIIFVDNHFFVWFSFFVIFLLLISIASMHGTSNSNEKYSTEELRIILLNLVLIDAGLTHMYLYFSLLLLPNSRELVFVLFSTFINFCNFYVCSLLFLSPLFLLIKAKVFRP